MFVDSELKIVSQIILPVQQCLMIPQGGTRAKIRKLYVHPQSLAQCRIWIQNHLPRVEIIETSSNARSAELAGKEKNSAAIAGIIAAEKYGLDVLEQDIQDNAANATRFLVLGRQCSPPTGDDRTSLMVSVRGQSRRAASCNCGVPALQNQHDENRIAPEQAEGVEYSSSLIATAMFRTARSRRPSRCLSARAVTSRCLARIPTRNKPEKTG